MDDEHVLTLVEAVHGAHLDAVHGFAANTAIDDDVGQLGVFPADCRGQLIHHVRHRGARSLAENGREDRLLRFNRAACGPATSGGMLTTCRREGETWILNGQKKWIGNSTFSDINVIWARDEASGQVKDFVVEKDNPGFSVEKIKTKMALRVVQNGLITLTDCRVPEADRLQNANTFKDCGKVLRMTRTGVAWFAVGCQMGAYEHALRYAHERIQFGKPIGGFQLVQDLLVRMLGNVTSCQAMMLRLSQLQDQGLMKDEHASLAKAFTTVKCRETVGYARELLGGNGILLENHVGRYVADAEAIYSYEGTREMNTLIVGKSITGLGAFV
jgi:glutaryl-CoA dehydrogenase